MSITKKNILILASQVPFSRGGAEYLVDALCAAIRELGHKVDIFSLPFNAEPKSGLAAQMLQWRNLDLSEVAGNKVDLVIGTKFPTFYARHPNKIIWMIHQHRQAYELLETRFGDFKASNEDEAVRKSIHRADAIAIKESKAVYTISSTVSDRLRRYLNIDSVSLEPPLHIVDQNVERHITKKPYLLSVGRLCSAKRTEMLIRMMPYVDGDMTLKIVGVADEPGFEDFLYSEVEKHSLSSRVEFLGSVSQADLVKYYSECAMVVFPPFDEDFGFVMYEAAMYRKPIVTTNDSGYVADQVGKVKTGLVVEPSTEALAEACNILWKDTTHYDEIVARTQDVKINTDWSKVAKELVQYA